MLKRDWRLKIKRRVARLSDFPFTFHFHALEKEMATHSSVLAWRIPGMGEPGGLPSMGLHRLGHDWSDLAAAAAVSAGSYKVTISVPANRLLSNFSALLRMKEPECRTTWFLGLALRVTNCIMGCITLHRKPPSHKTLLLEVGNHEIAIHSINVHWTVNYLLCSKPSSRQWGYRENQRYKFLPSWSLHSICPSKEKLFSKQVSLLIWNPPCTVYETLTWEPRSRRSSSLNSPMW